MIKIGQQEQRKIKGRTSQNRFKIRNEDFCYDKETNSDKEFLKGITEIMNKYKLIMKNT